MEIRSGLAGCRGTGKSGDGSYGSRTSDAETPSPGRLGRNLGSLGIRGASTAPRVPEGACAMRIRGLPRGPVASRASLGR